MTDVTEPTRTKRARADERIQRLSAVSLNHIVEPETQVTGSVGPDPILPRELLSVADLTLDLTDDQWHALAREELASILDAGVRFESVLMAGFAMMLAWQPDLTDARATYVLHEMGEETRHSRLFIRVIEQLDPQAVNPFIRGAYTKIDRWITRRALPHQALFCVMVLAGEEAPDLLQRQTSEHPDTDPYIRQVGLYHRAEEARHLAFARTLLPEVWRDASMIERAVIRHLGPLIMEGIFDSLVHPGVYRTVGLPGWRTWNQVRRSPTRRAQKAEAFRPILDALQDAGAFANPDRLPRSWRHSCATSQTPSIRHP
jgi:hypothetical protein